MSLHSEPNSTKTVQTSADSLKDGWIVLEELSVFFAKFWVLIIGGIGIYIFIRKYRKNE